MVIYFALHGVALHYQLPVPVHFLDRQRNETFTIPLKVHRENKTKNNKTLINTLTAAVYSISISQTMLPAPISPLRCVDEPVCIFVWPDGFQGASTYDYV